MSGTPPAGIRLRGGAPIPPAPSLGRHIPVTADGAHLGGVVETHPGRWVPACVHPDCLTALPPSTSHTTAAEALYAHWGATHEETAA